MLAARKINSQPYSNTLYEHYKKIAARIGAPDSRVHDLRHTFAVISLQNKDDVKTVQENLGHATASFTLDVYGHVSERMRQESADRMQEYIQSVIGKKKKPFRQGKNLFGMAFLIQ